MPNGTTIYRFGPFELDAGQRHLTRDGEQILLPERHFDVLGILLEHAGQFVSKDTLIDIAWNGEEVSESNLEVAIWNLRKVLGKLPSGAQTIENRVRRGYRIALAVQRHQAARAATSLDALLAPYGAFIDGRAAVELLYLDALERAIPVFEDALSTNPDHVPGHIGLAYAGVLRFESTRDDAEPNVDALKRGLEHAEYACLIDPSSADGWSALAYASHRLGQVERAVKAVHKAIALQPNNWHHRLRHSSITWGEACLQASEAALSLCPGLAFPQWFITRVFLARQAWERALEHATAGCAAQDAQRREAGGCHAVGLHLLRAHVLFVLDQCEEALDELAHERELADPQHVFGRECTGNTLYLRGAIYYRIGCRDEARTAFLEAREHVPAHPLVEVGLAAVSASSDALLAPIAGREADTIERAMTVAAALSILDRHEEAARTYREALVTAPPGPAGSMMPVDPLIDACAHTDVWRDALALLRDRAI